jgi:hypothetical protein
VGATNKSAANLAGFDRSHPAAALRHSTRLIRRLENRKYPDAQAIGREASSTRRTAIDVVTATAHEAELKSAARVRARFTEELEVWRKQCHARSGDCAAGSAIKHNAANWHGVNGGWHNRSHREQQKNWKLHTRSGSILFSP